MKNNFLDFLSTKSPKSKESVGFTNISEIKKELSLLKKEFEEIKIELGNSPKGIGHTDFPRLKEIQERQDVLNKEMHTYVSILKHDPTETHGPSRTQEIEEIEFLKKELDVLNQSISQLNMITRDEFLKNGAINPDGSKNKTYYALREGLDPLLKTREDEIQDLSEQKSVSDVNIGRIEDIYSSNEYKKLKNNLNNFMTVELAPIETKDRVDRARAFLDYCEDKGERIDIKPILEQYDEVSRVFAQARHQLDLMNFKIFEAGLRVTPDDLKPYLDKLDK